MIYSLIGTFENSNGELELKTIYSSEDAAKVAKRYNKPFPKKVLTMGFYEGEKLLLRRSASDFIGQAI